ncbi:MFS transporter [Streptococcus infantarius]|uniref:MFS transporter n=1 Tax=Streptococcus infantarius TaxID=102684 RepID=UPI0022E06B5B|nr:MFS transporter [Streptococcus infantarius]
MKTFLEKFSLLSLSLMLVSTLSPSTALPQMITTFHQQGYAASRVEFLFSLSSFAILAMLLLNPIIERLISERLSIILGLLLIAFGGSMPVVFQTYSLVFVSRILLGIGIGLINSRAISIISETYTGSEQAQMLGLRGSFEIIGNALLTMIVGFIVVLGWSWTFSVYLFALPILAVYLIFAPKPKVEVEEPQQDETRAKFRKEDILYIVGLSLLAGFVININSANSLRIPVIVDQLHLGSPRQASLILSGMMLMGILSGICFEGLLGRFSKNLITISMIPFALGLFMVGFANNLWVMLIGAMLSGFWYSIVVTSVFSDVSTSISPQLIGNATTLILIFCNLGGASAAIVLNLFSKFSPQPGFAFIIYAVISLVICLGLIIKTRFSKKN